MYRVYCSECLRRLNLWLYIKFQILNANAFALSARLSILVSTQALSAIDVERHGRNRQKQGGDSRSTDNITDSKEGDISTTRDNSSSSQLPPLFKTRSTNTDNNSSSKSSGDSNFSTSGSSSESLEFSDEVSLMISCLQSN